MRVLEEMLDIYLHSSITTEQVLGIQMYFFKIL